MKTNFDDIYKHALEAESVWKSSYKIFPNLINKNNYQKGAEIGVAFGGHADSILKNTKIERLYGIDPYLHLDNYKDPFNLPVEYFEKIYVFMLERLKNYNNRFKHIRKLSKDAVDDIKEYLDFVYIDAEHTYNAVIEDIILWYPKIREGGIIGGHDYGHLNFPGVKKAVDEYFSRFNYKINLDESGVWWVKKEKISISFIIPAYNCSETVEKSVDSIMESNFEVGDELIIVNDCSTDNTLNKLKELNKKYEIIKIVNHKINKGGGAARNTAVENSNNKLIFCLDSDNLLDPYSVNRLKNSLIKSVSDIAAFKELLYFKNNKEEVTHKWVFPEGILGLDYCLRTNKNPISSGNYLYTKFSWERAGGYPEHVGALDAWGFGFKQLATSSTITILDNSFYFHRYGNESYWVRDSKNKNMSLMALQIIIPFLDLIDERDKKYLFNYKNIFKWFDNIDKRPIRLKKQQKVNKGFMIVFLNIKNGIKKLKFFNKLKFLKNFYDKWHKKNY